MPDEEYSTEGVNPGAEGVNLAWGELAQPSPIGILRRGHASPHGESRPGPGVSAWAASVLGSDPDLLETSACLRAVARRRSPAWARQAARVEQPNRESEQPSQESEWPSRESERPSRVREMPAQPRGCCAGPARKRSTGPAGLLLYSGPASDISAWARVCRPDKLLFRPGSITSRPTLLYAGPTCCLSTF
jgi:hypothetical protein